MKSILSESNDLLANNLVLTDGIHLVTCKVKEIMVELYGSGCVPMFRDIGIHRVVIDKIKNSRLSSASKE